MTTYAVTGVTGPYGRLAVAALRARGVEPGDIVAIARTPAKAADLADAGVVVRQGDYSRPETLPAALAGVTTLLLVSGSEVGHRVAQHTAVIDAAKAAGVTRVVYTSAPHADATTLALAPEHKATEDVLQASGVDFTILRNGWYLENYTDALGRYLDSGEILGAGGDGRIAAATRADLAAAAAAVLTEAGHENRVYELGGTPFTFAELAATITEVTGTPVVYRDLTVEEFATALRSSGMDADTASFVASLDGSIALGELDTDSGDLQRLIGRPSTSPADAVRLACQGLSTGAAGA
ncbi:NAD(P)H dehydrogenase (quinone) [Actinoalloteichus hoggarensis]|uniref:Quinone oxidoreductase 2 n=1 Tax=Actinoalloteichus hoggarensis TaxID=1470176 RepID=A0A221W3X0_9PSEU|nr:SDR family oxidoreductase [Actinoalloteichus hoggarensis]ASO20454.1 Quinone oxidoreductase 2 [Actinoalloteichus hoggarensis]MBB5923494.1 NAD(P)H dehydrogenase (quinone) [Actinoalloteichus hoggarensis]